MGKKRTVLEHENIENEPNSEIAITEILRKKPWSEEEDELVKKLVEKYGPQRWSFIAKFVTGRLGKQCRERWHNHLNPQILKVEWMFHEEWVLFLAHTAHGNRWAEMTKMIPGRTDNSIKNHWNSTMRKKINELMNILESFFFAYLGILKKKNNIHFLKKEEVPVHYFEKEGELLVEIEKNKESIFLDKIPRINLIGPSNEQHSVRKLLCSNDGETILRIKEPLNQTKSTEKEFFILERFLLYSSIKKSERSLSGIKENLGSLIFETPPKGSVNRNNPYHESGKFFYENLEVSPTPFKFYSDNISINDFFDNHSNKLSN